MGALLRGAGAGAATGNGSALVALSVKRADPLEEIEYAGVISTGAADDLERASELARQMVTRFGMSERLGKATWGRSMAQQFLKSPFDMEERNYSERTAETIDDELRRIQDKTYARVRQLLTANRGPRQFTGDAGSGVHS